MKETTNYVEMRCMGETGPNRWTYGQYDDTWMIEDSEESRQRSCKQQRYRRVLNAASALMVGFCLVIAKTKIDTRSSQGYTYTSPQETGTVPFKRRGQLIAALEDFMINPRNPELLQFGSTLNDWNVSSISDFSFLFARHFDFNKNIDGWDTSGATTMDFMFHYCHHFNQPIGKWNTSRVESMASILSGAHRFNQQLSSWDTSMVTDLSFALHDARAFNQPLHQWNVSSVTTMKGTFSHTIEWSDDRLGQWDVSAVTDAQFLFHEATRFNAQLDTWNVSSFRNLRAMFKEARTFDQPLGSWDVSSVTDIHSTFAYATTFNQDIGQWNVTNVKNSAGTFLKAKSFLQNLCPWGHRLPQDAKTTSMFSQSGCHGRDHFETTILPYGPLCLSCSK